MGEKALVVFSGRTDFWWQGLLRKGFRHCAVVLWQAEHWVVVDPLATRLEVRLLGLSDRNLADSLCRRGMRVVEVVVPVDRSGATLPGLWTCVEAVKRTLGVRSAWVQTPWQLYRYLEQKNKKKVLDFDDA